MQVDVNAFLATFESLFPTEYRVVMLTLENAALKQQAAQAAVPEGVEAVAGQVMPDPGGEPPKHKGDVVPIAPEKEPA